MIIYYFHHARMPHTVTINKPPLTIMKIRILLFTLITFIALSGLILTAKDKTIDWDELPLACQQTVRAHAENFEIEEVEMEWENGHLFYEVEINTKGRQECLILTPDGDLFALEKEIPLKELPEPVKSRISGYKNDHKAEVELVQVTLYEIEIGTKELILDSLGRTIKIDGADKMENDDEEEED